MTTKRIVSTLGELPEALQSEVFRALSKSWKTYGDQFVVARKLAAVYRVFGETAVMRILSLKTERAEARSHVAARRFKRSRRIARGPGILRRGV